MLSCLRRMDCMLRITICKDTREGHLRVAKPEEAPSLLGTLCSSMCNGLTDEQSHTDVGGASLSHWM